MLSSADEIQKITAINEKAALASSSVKLLSNISWPSEFETQFLKAYQKGKDWSPEVTYQINDYSEQRRVLEALLQSFTAHSPIEVYTKKTIASYLSTIEINQSIGSDQFTEISKKIFGVPDDILAGSKKTIVHAAEQLVEGAMEFSSPFLKDPLEEINAQQIKEYMDKRIKAVFASKGPLVEIVTGLSAKATATPRLIRLKAGNEYTHYDFKQLFYHEVMTHSLTALNGERQPILKCMGQGSLRTLKTQEGLATFSEVITGAMDINRLKRLALRVLAIDKALDGASFREVFEFFLSTGQNEHESYQATHRVFRGGYPNKNIVFTKDCIYLEGLFRVHTLFRWAMKHNRLDVCHLLFAGRLSLEDVFELEDAYHYQWIAPPTYLPSWFKKIEGLAGTLSFSLIANLVRINITDKDFFKAP